MNLVSLVPYAVADSDSMTAVLLLLCEEAGYGSVKVCMNEIVWSRGYGYTNEAYQLPVPAVGLPICTANDWSHDDHEAD